MKPLMIDLFAGLGGWAEGGLAEGYRVVGFDVERHRYLLPRREQENKGGNWCEGNQSPTSWPAKFFRELVTDENPLKWVEYPAQLVLQDVLTLHGSQFKDAALIVASPPCQEFSYMAMPWSIAKEKQRRIEADPAERKRLTALFDACFRIQREAIEAAGHFIPLVVENVRGANKWVGRSRWNYGSFHLWGDVPALMPMTKGMPSFKGGDRNIGRANGEHKWNTEFKLPGFRFDGSGKSFQSAAVEGVKNSGARRWNDFNDFGTVSPSWTTAGSPGQKVTGQNPVHDHIKQGGDWFNAEQPSISRRHGSKSTARKAASAQIAKIPLALSRYIARCYLPQESP